MQIPAKINFLNIDPSPALESRIQEKIDRLDQRFSDIMGCQVMIEAANHHQNKGRLYSVRIDVTMPGGELVVSNHPGKNPDKHDKIFAAMNDAFMAIERQLIRFKETRRQEVKQHSVHWHTGDIIKLIVEPGFGFVKTSDALEVYFHRNCVENDKFDDLEVGEKIRFVIAEMGEEGEKGPQASIVKPGNKKIKKHSS